MSTHRSKNVKRHERLRRYICIACDDAGRGARMVYAGEEAKSRHQRSRPAHRGNILETPRVHRIAVGLSGTRLQQSWEHYVRELRAGPDCRLKKLVDSLDRALESVGGFWHPGRRVNEEHLWAGNMPRRFDPHDCWVGNIDDDAFEEDVRANCAANTRVYRVAQPQCPVKDASVARVLHCLSHPNPLPYHAVNVASTMATLRMPASWLGPRLYTPPGAMLTIVTPKDCVVPPQIGKEISHGRLETPCLLGPLNWGMGGLTALRNGCVKVWALWPGRGNLETFCRLEETCAGDMFVPALAELRGAIFIITDDSEALYLPPGCLHTTVTTQGGFVPGITFSSAKGLEATAAHLCTNVKDIVDASADHRAPLLEALVMGFWFEDVETSLGPAILCELFSRLESLAKRTPTYAERLQKAGPTCRICSRSWKRHVAR